MSIII